MSIPRRYIFISFVVVALIGVGLLLAPSFAYAQESLNTNFCTPGITGGSWNTEKCVTWFLAIIAEAVLGLMGSLLWLAGLILNQSVITTVVEMGKNVTNIDAINTAWTIFRDLGNIALIFLMVAIGISTILQLQSFGIKTLLAKLIIVALLLNFSLFFTKLIIDGSNLLAVQFWDQIAVDGSIEDAGISNKFMSALQLTSIYNTDSGAVYGSIISGDNEKVGLDTRVADGSITPGKVFLVGVMGSILILVAAFVFFATAFLLITRFVLLVLLMMISPLAFIAMIAPLTSGYAKKWWSTLLNQSLFAPAYFALTWAALLIIQSPAFKGTINDQAGAAGSFGDLAEGNPGSIAVFLQYLMVIVLICASLIIANKMGAYGSGALIKTGSKWGKRAAGASTLGAGGRLLRTSVGRGASWAANTKIAKDFAASSKAGDLTLRSLRGIGNRSFDARNVGGLGKESGLGKGIKGGYNQVLERQVKDREKFGGSLGYDEEKVGGFEAAQENRKKERGRHESDRAKYAEDERSASLRLEQLRQEGRAQTPEFDEAERQVTEAQRQRQAAEKRIEETQEEIKALEKSIGDEKGRRKKQYADRLGSTRTTLGVDRESWGRFPKIIKVARKNKEAAAKIRKGKSEDEKLLEGLTNKLKDNKELQDSLKPDDE